MPLIARQVGGSTRTLCRGLAAATIPERQRRTGAPGCLDPSTTSLQPRWEAGCHHATHLWRDLQAQGFAGSYHVVAMYVAPLRRGQPVRPSRSAPPPTSTERPVLTARQLAYLLVRRP